MKIYDILRFLKKQGYNVYVTNTLDVLNNDERLFYNTLENLYTYLTTDERYVLDYIYRTKTGNYMQCAKAMRKSTYHVYKIRENALLKLQNLLYNKNAGL